MSYIAVDIGATNIRVASGNQEGFTHKILEKTDKKNGPNGIPVQISNMIELVTDAPPVSIGIGSIGPIDIYEGSIKNTPNYPFNEIPVVKPLTEVYGSTVKIVNDCAAAVLGEKKFGAGKGIDDLFYVTMSTGLGGGAIVDGHLLLGKDGNAVEVGHFTLNPYSKIICGCGSPGHWEAFMGGKNFPYYARGVLFNQSWQRSLINDLTGGNLRNLTGKMVFDAAKQGDMIAIHVVEEIGKINAIGFANIVNGYDPELITIGGSVALNNPDMILYPIEHYIDRHLLNRKPEIMITPLGGDVVLYGALALALEI